MPAETAANNQNAANRDSFDAKQDFLSGPGDVRAQMRAKDWSSTPLGAPGTWPQTLKTVIRTMLSSRFAMWMAWGKERLCFYNDAYVRDTLGKKHPWALGRPATEVWAEIWSDIGPRIDRVFQTGEATWDTGLLLFLERSGYTEETYHTFSYSPLYDDQGQPCGMLCVVMEETERLIAERRAGSLRELATALNATKTESDVLEAIEKCVQADARDLPFTLMYLFDGEESKPRLVLPTKSTLQTALVDNIGQDGWPLILILQRNTPVEISDLARRFGTIPSGPWSKAPQQAILIPIAQQGQGRPAGVFIAGLNPHRPVDEGYRGFVNLFVGQISSALANAHAYEEERRRAEALAELDRAKTAFFSNVSHEFRTPLTLMLGPLEDTISHANGILPRRAAEELTVVHRNGLRLLKLVNALLDFSRIEAGRMRATYEPVDLAVYTAELASVFRSAIEKAGMRLVVECPPLAEPVYVDRGMWEKVVLNLLSNAFKFTLAGEIAVSLAAEADQAVLRVRDTGCGIPEAELPRLFERFHRVEGTKGRTHEGTGIGLALVQELIKLHGGKVELQSRLGEGSTFTVRIPLGSAHLPADRISQTSSHTPDSIGADSFLEEAKRWLPTDRDEETPVYGAEAVRPSTSARIGRRPRIVLADDNADMRQYVRRLLSGEYDVEAVNNGAAALEAVRGKGADLVVSDVMMPQLDGFALLAELRGNSHTAKIPIVLLSARAGEEATLAALQAGADDYLVKPFSARELLGRIAALLERKRFQQALAAADDRMRIALDAARMAAWDWDPAEDAVIISETAAEVYGLLPGATIQSSKFGLSLLHPEDVEPHRARLLAAIKNVSGFQSQFRIIRPRDGAIAWMEERGVARRDEATGRIRVSGVAMDVTESKKAEQEIAELLERERVARDQAERAGRLKEDFLATLSHELRTPLNAILGWTQILQRGALDRETVTEAITVISRNARAQVQLIGDLLDMGRITSGKLRLEVQRVDFSDVISAAIESIRPAAEARELRLTKTLDSVRTIVSGDPHRLQQIVWNLLSNAVKFTPKGGHVRVILHRINSHVEMHVVDTGQGIDPEFLPYLFERFRQADPSPKRSFGGLGLGLAIVKQLVELHGGTIRASSPGPGKGATFTVSLPVAVSNADGHNQRIENGDGEMSQALSLVSLNGIKVLVVDDEPDARNMVKRILDGCNATVVTAGSVAEALETFRSHRPHVILSDIGMPERDGYEFIRTVRSLRREEGGYTPAAALTAYARPEDRRQALMAGYQSHVVKPADPAELVTVVASLAGRLGAAQQT